MSRCNLLDPEAEPTDAALGTMMASAMAGVRERAAARRAMTPEEKETYVRELARYRNFKLPSSAMIVAMADQLEAEILAEERTPV